MTIATEYVIEVHGAWSDGIKGWRPLTRKRDRLPFDDEPAPRFASEVDAVAFLRGLESVSFDDGLYWPLAPWRAFSPENAPVFRVRRVDRDEP